MSIKERTPVPALGGGWFLLRDDEVIQKGDMVTGGGDYGYVDANTSIGKTLPNCSGILRAARYFGPAEEPEPQPATKPIDWTKPVRTKDGRAVRVLCTDGPGEYPVVGLVDDTPVPQTWTLDGCFWAKELSECYLENVPSRIQREYWVNVYDGVETLLWYDTKKEADENGGQRFACVKITIDCEEGEGL